MDFRINEELRELKESAIKFGQSLNDSIVQAQGKNLEFSREHWKKFADFGLQGLNVPAELGGMGLDLFSCVLIMEGIGFGYKDNGMLFSINAHMWSCIDPILKFGTQDQKVKYIKALSRGDLIGVHAITEPGSGSDAFSMNTTVKDIGENYVLHGSKTFITNGPIADVVVVFAKHDGGPSHGKISCFIIDKETKGFCCSKHIEKMGLNSSPFGQLFFDECMIPKENLLGQEGQGIIIFASSMDSERACLLSTYIGVMERQIEECVNYAKERKQFGKSIFEFQSISHMLADMKVRLEASRLLIYRVAWLKDSGRSATQDSAIAKLFVSEAFVQNSISAMKIHGGYGYTTEYTSEKELRDAMGGLFYSGTSEIMRNIIAELID